MFLSSWDKWDDTSNGKTSSSSSHKSKKRSTSPKPALAKISGSDRKAAAAPAAGDDDWTDFGDNGWDESAWDTVEQEYKMKMNLK